MTVEVSSCYTHRSYIRILKFRMGEHKINKNNQYIVLYIYAHPRIHPGNNLCPYFAFASGGMLKLTFQTKKFILWYSCVHALLFLSDSVENKTQWTHKYTFNIIQQNCSSYCVHRCCFISTRPWQLTVRSHFQGPVWKDARLHQFEFFFCFS